MNIVKKDLFKITIISILSLNLIATASVGAKVTENAITKESKENQNISKSILPNDSSSVIELDGLKYTVKSISKKDSNGLKEASDGKTFICIEMDVENNSVDNTQITSVMNFSLTDNSGNWFNVVMPEGKDSLNGTLPSGKTKSGKVYFDADINTKNFILTFRSRISKDKSITINNDGKIITNPEHESDNVNSNNQEKYEKKYEFNQTVDCDHLKFTIGNIKVSNYYNGNFAKDGFKFVHVNVEAHNTGSHKEQITSSFMFKIKDENNNYYRVRLPEEKGINSIIAPNQKLSGEIVFEVEEDLSDFTMEIKPWIYKDYEALIDFSVK